MHWHFHTKITGRDAAIKLENEAFYEMSRTPQARALVGLFLSDQYIVKLAKNRSRALADKFVPVKTPSVIGAGIMGGAVSPIKMPSGAYRW